MPKPKSGQAALPLQVRPQTQHQAIPVFLLCALCVLCVKIRHLQPHAQKKGDPENGSPHKANITKAYFCPLPDSPPAFENILSVPITFPLIVPGIR